jgi:hypothetical protein
VSKHHRSGSRGRAAVELGSSVGETAKAQEERFAGVLVVLMHAEVKALGFCTELSTAATMWRPAAAWEFVARAEKGSKEGKQGRAEGRGTCGGRGSRRWAAAACTAAAEAAAPTAEQGRQGSRGGSEEEEEREKVRRTYVQN